MSKLLFYYSTLAALFITTSSLFTSHKIGPLVFTILFLPVTGYFIIEFIGKLRSKADDEPKFKSGEIVTIGIVFLLLLSTGVKNVIEAKSSSKEESNNAIPSSTPVVFKTTPAPQVKKLTITIEDGSPFVNIREKPSLYSEKIGEAKNGDLFTYNKVEGEWYELNLENGKVGYVSNKYVKENN